MSGPYVVFHRDQAAGSRPRYRRDIIRNLDRPAELRAVFDDGRGDDAEVIFVVRPDGRWFVDLRLPGRESVTLASGQVPIGPEPPDFFEIVRVPDWLSVHKRLGFGLTPPDTSTVLDALDRMEADPSLRICEAPGCVVTFTPAEYGQDEYYCSEHEPVRYGVEPRPIGAPYPDEWAVVDPFASAVMANDEAMERNAEVK